ncbi:hypothetical protein D3C72_2192010 [compost metagenome]
MLAQEAAHLHFPVAHRNDPVDLATLGDVADGVLDLGLVVEVLHGDDFFEDLARPILLEALLARQHDDLVAHGGCLLHEGATGNHPCDTEEAQRLFHLGRLGGLGRCGRGRRGLLFLGH